MAGGRVADGTQRPNLSGNPRNNCSTMDVVNNTCNFFNISAFSDPGDQTPGNSPRFNSDLRGSSIRDLDLSFFKNFAIRENLKLELRAEFFNFTNTPRFANPGASFGDPSFGTISGQMNSPRQAQMGIRAVF